MLVYNDAGEYLLHLRDNRPGIWEPGSWSLLGGGREPSDRSLEETARRELREEAGLEVGVLEPLAVQEVSSGDAATVVQVFTGRWNGDPAALHLTEGVMLHWFDLHTIPRLMMSPSTLALVQHHVGTRLTDASSCLPSGAVHGGAPSAGVRAVPNIIGVHLYLEDSRGRVLLGRRHPDCAYAGGMHHFLAGHCEQESAVRCLVREADEEAGLSIDPADAELVHAVHVLDNPGGQPRLQLVFRVRRWRGEPEVREPDKCLSWGWFDPGDLPAQTVPYTRAAITGIAEGRLFTEMGWS